MDRSDAQGEVTLWLERWSHGDSAALEQLTPLVYDQLRHVAAGLLRRERDDHTLQPTALVHEAFQQLLRTNRITLRDRAHFFTFAARLMRRILVDHARRLNAAKRGMSLDHIPLNPELAWIDASAELLQTLDLEEAMNALSAFDADKARAVELRYFLGCTVEESAALLGVSPSTVERDLRFSLAWLHHRLHPLDL